MKLTRPVPSQVEIYEDNSLTCASDVSALTPDQTHSEDPGCAVEEHDHSGDGDDAAATCGVSGASTTRAFGLVSLLAAAFAFFAH